MKMEEESTVNILKYVRLELSEVTHAIEIADIEKANMIIKSLYTFLNNAIELQN